MKYKLLGVLAGFCVLMFACKSKKKLTNAAQVQVDFENKKEVVKTIRTQKQTFNYLSSQMDVSYSGAGNSYDFNLHLKMKSGDTIWANATAILGLEVIRALITKDSVFILNRLERTCTAQSIDYFENILGRKVTISQLQDIFIGNSIFENNENAAYKTEENTVSFTHTESGFNIVQTFFKDILRPNTIVANKNGVQQNINLKYDSYQSDKEKTFPYLIDIDAKNVVDVYKIKLKVNSIDTSVITSFPFSIPKSYERN